VSHIDQQKADLACNFFELLLKHSGEYYGEPFLLTPWQEEAIANIFGHIDDDGENLIRLVYMELPKKAGKTEWAAGLVVLFLALTELPGCQVYGAAAGQRQALNVYRAATAMVEQEPLLRARLRVLRSTHRIIKRNEPDSFYAAIAADGDFSDGVNPRFVVADELHRWRTRKQIENWDVLRLGGIARKSKTVTVAITTAGVVKESPLAWRMHEKVCKIEAGVQSDPTFYGRIYSAGVEDDWESEATWIKANPSLRENGGFLDIAKIREEYESCKGDASGASAFRRYYLNLWDQKENRAVDMRLWNKCQSTFAGLGWPHVRDHHETVGHFINRPCWVGVDLSMTTDMSAVALVFPCDDGGVEVVPFYWMPEEGLRKAELRDGMPYCQWAEEGLIETCEGPAIDYRQVRARLKWAAEMFNVVEFCFDRFNSREMSVQMIDDGFTCVEIPQIYTGLSEATKKFLRLVAEGKLRHGGHPVLSWNASCLSLKSDGNDLVRPVKPDREHDSSRIDGVSATITAMARALGALETSGMGAVCVDL
jgi:phage terminase large subunit-like protein